MSDSVPVIKYMPKNASAYDKWCLTQEIEYLKWQGRKVEVIEYE